MQSQLKHCSWYIKVFPAKIMCHGISLLHILTPYTKLLHIPAPKRVKFANFVLTYEILGFKDIQICQTLRFQYLISNSIIQSILHIQVSKHMDM